MSAQLTPELQRLIEAAYQQTLKRFEDEVNNGDRDPVAELAGYRKQRRDYASLLRIGAVPDEARTLAQQLLDAHRINPDPPTRHVFERETAALLVRLYDAFIAFANDRAQGSR